MDLTKELWVILSDKPILNKEGIPIDYKHEVADLIDLKTQKVMTREGHCFNLKEVNLVNKY